KIQSLSLHDALPISAENAWDMVFRKYVTDVGGGMMYGVTGTLHNPNVTVAKNEEPSGNPDPNNLTYSEEINTIGYDWKTFNGTEDRKSTRLNSSHVK